jgi:hypothetical protein
MRVWNITTKCVAFDSYYRPVYHAAREQYAAAVHVRECTLCGKPAKVGSPLNLGHQHMRALRAIGRAPWASRSTAR